MVLDKMAAILSKTIQKPDHTTTDLLLTIQNMNLFGFRILETTVGIQKPDASGFQSSRFQMVKKRAVEEWSDFIVGFQMVGTTDIY